MANDDLLQLSIMEAADMVRRRQVSPVELTEAALAQAERLQPAINSFITLMGDQALAQAREQEAALARGDSPGLLAGIPVGIKDNITVAGVRATVGTKVLADNVAEEDAHVVTLCQQAGAIILGKENLEEFAAGATSNNPHYGAVRNPWALEHIPGGSSGGGGANVASEVTFASLGTDLGGSVRLPGTFCGVVGLKQTYGRVSQRGLMVTSFNGDHIGPMTRSVADAALMLQVMAGYDPLDPSTVPVPVPDYSASIEGGVRGLRMGIPTNHYFDSLDSEVEASVRQAIAALEELGAQPIEVSLPMMKYVGAVRVATMADSMVTHEPYLESNRDDYGPNVLYRTLAGQFVLGRDYSKALKVQTAHQGGVRPRLARSRLPSQSHVASACPTHRRRHNDSGRSRTPRARPRLGYDFPQHLPRQRHRAPRHHRPLRLHPSRSTHRPPANGPPLRGSPAIPSRPRLRAGLPRPRQAAWRVGVRVWPY